VRMSKEARSKKQEARSKKHEMNALCFLPVSGAGEWH
jgi:hypothetical protein